MNASVFTVTVKGEVPRGEYAHQEDRHKANPQSRLLCGIHSIPVPFCYGGTPEKVWAASYYPVRGGPLPNPAKRH